MPTGYTSNIKKGISFKTFALNCARAFGACISMRDKASNTPIPVFKPSTHYEERIKEIKEEIELLETMDIETATIEAKKEYNKETERYRKYINEANELRTKYEAMLLKIADWQPPTVEHDGLKDFMKEQIQTSIKHDCDISYYVKELGRIRLLISQEWRSKKKRELAKSLEYYSKEAAKEKERVEARNNWVKELRGSLK